MSLQSRIDSLQTRHASLDARLHDEDTRPMPNQAMLNQIKLEKLRVKRELERLRQS